MNKWRIPLKKTWLDNLEENNRKYSLEPRKDTERRRRYKHIAMKRLYRYSRFCENRVWVVTSSAQKANVIWNRLEKRFDKSYMNWNFVFYSSLLFTVIRSHLSFNVISYSSGRYSSHVSIDVHWVHIKVKSQVLEQLQNEFSHREEKGQVILRWKKEKWRVVSWIDRSSM